MFVGAVGDGDESEAGIGEENWRDVFGDEAAPVIGEDASGEGTRGDDGMTGHGGRTGRRCRIRSTTPRSETALQTYERRNATSQPTTTAASAASAAAATTPTPTQPTTT